MLSNSTFSCHGDFIYAADPLQFSLCLKFNHTAVTINATWQYFPNTDPRTKRTFFFPSTDFAFYVMKHLSKGLLYTMITFQVPA